MKLTITQRNDELIAQIANQEPVPLIYAGNEIFKIERFGVDLLFMLAEKKWILKQNGTETEFVRE